MAEPIALPHPPRARPHHRLDVPELAREPIAQGHERRDGDAVGGVERVKAVTMAWVAWANLRLSSQ